MIFRNKQSRLLPVLLLWVTLLFIFNYDLFGESFFIKDGTIIEGKTVKISDKKIDVKLTDGNTSEIQRKDLLRTVFTEDYKIKRYLYLKDSSAIEGYIVYEDTFNYIYRTVLNSPDENKISKNEIKIISSERILFPAAKNDTEHVLTREENIRTRSALIRLGLGVRAPLGSEIYKFNKGLEFPVNVDAFVYRMRDSTGNGLDFFARYCYSNYDSGSISENTSYINEKYGIDNISSGITINSVTWDQYAFGGGLRYIHGFYVGGVLWQGYAMAYYQYSWIQLNVSGSSSLEKFYVYYTNGIVVGAGIEAALSSHFGLFAEYTYGYSPAFPSNKNTEAGVLRFGASFRMLNFL